MELDDPAGAGAVAGIAVGVLLAVSYAGVLLFFREEVLEAIEAEVGTDPGLSLAAIFWIGIASAVLFWLSTGLLVGSILGVVYDWLERPGAPVLLGLVTTVGLLSGVVTASPAPLVVTITVQTAAWLCYVPTFGYLFRDGRVRSGSSASE